MMFVFDSKVQLFVVNNLNELCSGKKNPQLDLSAPSFPLPPPPLPVASIESYLLLRATKIIN